MNAVHLVRLQALPENIIERVNRTRNSTGSGDGWYVFCAPEGEGVRHLSRVLGIDETKIDEYIAFDDEAWYTNEDGKQEAISKAISLHPEAQVL